MKDLERRKVDIEEKRFEVEVRLKQKELEVRARELELKEKSLEFKWRKSENLLHKLGNFEQQQLLMQQQIESLKLKLQNIGHQDGQILEMLQNIIKINESILWNFK